MKRLFCILVLICFSTITHAAFTVIVGSDPGWYNASDAGCSGTSCSVHVIPPPDYEPDSGLYANGNTQNFFISLGVQSTVEDWYKLNWYAAGDVVTGSVGANGVFADFAGPSSGSFLFMSYVGLANNNFYIDADATSPNAKVGFSINPAGVPIPAAVLMFFPALLGFFGLRRKFST